MSIDRKYPTNADPRLKSILEAIYNAIDELQKRPSTTALSAEDRKALVSQAATQAAGLLGPFAQPVLGLNTSDPALQGIPTGNGTVTSVGLVVPAQFSASAAITSAGSITVSWTNQVANKILSGPTTGAAAAPTFRSLVSADLPVDAVQSTNSKVTAAAPYTNDGKIAVTINGVVVTLMTTA